MALETVVGRLDYHLGPHWNMSLTITLIATAFSKDIYGAKGMNPTDISDAWLIH